MTFHRRDSASLYTLNTRRANCGVARCVFVYKNPLALPLGKGGSRPPVASPLRKVMFSLFFHRHRKSGRLQTYLEV